MRRAFTAIEIMIVVAIVGILAAIILPVIAPSKDRKRAREADKPITYAMKNTVTYTVRAICSNCMRSHKVESSVGVKVKTDHPCPWCGVKGEYKMVGDSQ